MTVLTAVLTAVLTSKSRLRCQILALDEEWGSANLGVEPHPPLRYEHVLRVIDMRSDLTL